jgi:phosphocarrier protein
MGILKKTANYHTNECSAEAIVSLPYEFSGGSGPPLRGGGLHASSSAAIVKLARFFRSDIWISRDGEQVNGKSIMGLMMIAAGDGSRILIVARGEDAALAVETLKMALEAGSMDNMYSVVSEFIRKQLGMRRSQMQERKKEGKNDADSARPAHFVKRELQEQDAMARALNEFWKTKRSDFDEYGKPGPSKIRVAIYGSVACSGVYWINENTPLLEFLSSPPTYTEGDFSGEVALARRDYTFFLALDNGAWVVRILKACAPLSPEMHILPFDFVHFKGPTRGSCWLYPISDDEWEHGGPI